MKYRIHHVNVEGKITSRTEKNAPEGYSFTLIAIELGKWHKNTPFQNLLDAARAHSASMGDQTAFVDEYDTIIVTRIRD